MTPLAMFESTEAQINSMVLLGTDNGEIEFIITNLRQIMRLAGIPTSIVKAAKHVLFPVLCHVFNLCLQSGHFPLVFKMALVLALCY